VLQHIQGKDRVEGFVDERQFLAHAYNIGRVVRHDLEVDHVGIVNRSLATSAVQNETVLVPSDERERILVVVMRRYIVGVDDAMRVPNRVGQEVEVQL